MIGREQQIIDSGEVWKVKNKWVQKCSIEDLCGKNEGFRNCYKCKGRGYLPLSGSTFSLALIIMDRRGI